MTRQDVFAILAVVGLIGGIESYNSHSLNNLEEKGVKTVAVIVSVSHKNVRAAFVGNGRRCEHVQSNLYKALEGETYALRYDPEDVAQRTSTSKSRCTTSGNTAPPKPRRSRQVPSRLGYRSITPWATKNMIGIKKKMRIKHWTKPAPPKYSTS